MYFKLFFVEVHLPFREMYLLIALLIMLCLVLSALLSGCRVLCLQNHFEFLRSISLV